MPDELADDLCSMSSGSSERSGSSTVSSTGSRSSLSSCSSIASVPKAGSVDPRLDLIRRLRSSDAARPGSALSPSDLRFVQRLGLGDIGSVYLEEVKCGGGELGERVVVAAKVMDKKEVEGRSKWGQARTERKILEMVGGHLFLPRLYGVVENDRWSCLLTDFCPSGDLHLLRQRQPNRRFPTPPSGNKRNAIPENATANTNFFSERGAGVADDEKLRSLRSCSRVPM